jgi:predicted nucleic acid-binding Zn finger protein
MSIAAQSKVYKALVEDLSERMARRGREENDGKEPWEVKRDEEELKQTLLALSSLVGPNLLDKALAISSRRDAIEEVRADCGRSAFVVRGELGEYKVLLTGYCNCPSFLGARSGASLPICKHLLATQLAKAQGTARLRKARDEDWATTAWGVSLVG